MAFVIPQCEHGRAMKQGWSHHTWYCPDECSQQQPPSDVCWIAVGMSLASDLKLATKFEYTRSATKFNTREAAISKVKEANRGSTVEWHLVCLDSDNTIISIEKRTD